MEIRFDYNCLHLNITYEKCYAPWRVIISFITHLHNDNSDNSMSFF